ncbi:hypothetical protein JCGZ_05020 [Jatropha curcas]|uniref:Protein kinase domain-containing protein n=1 Tax=Jatropha curcas TaxID=180498 RepID=A0A067KV60_JATCU|nr:hypothetical protein JCGZ_05020 [Jatropha curcas]
MSFLREISLQNNTFRSQIPHELGRLFRLQVLNLENNSFQGQIPSNFSLCSSLKILYLSYNKLIGKIPFQLSNLSKLIQLYVPDNYLNGPIPPSIGNLTLLKSLSARENFLIGTIPDTLGKLKQLSMFQIATNKLSGTLPSSFASLRGLRILDLSRNNLSGKIPEYLEKLSLEYLNLSFNNLEGEIPIKGVLPMQVQYLLKHHNVLEIADPALLQEDEGVTEGRKVECLIGIIKVGVSCSMESPQDRMDMGTAVSECFQLQIIMCELEKQSLPCIEETKVINLQQQGAAKSFVAECKVLQNIRHRNLVRIITSCSRIDFQGNDFNALVYEYMPNGKPEKWLHPGSEMYNESKPSSKNEHCSRCTIKSLLEYENIG